MTDEDSGKQMTLGEHLVELRKRVIRCLIAVGITTTITAFWGGELVYWITKPIIDAMIGAGFTDPKLLATGVADPFMVYMRIVLFAGLFLAAPYVLWEIWRFVAVALRPRERRWVYIVAPITVLLFVIGTCFAYFLAVRIGLQFLAVFAMDMTKMGIPIDFRPSLDDTVNLILMLSLFMGLVFQLPLVIVALYGIGIFDMSSLKSFRRYFILAAFIIGAIATPSVDPFNQTLMALPLILLYEIGVFVCWLFERRSARKLAG